MALKNRLRGCRIDSRNDRSAADISNRRKHNPLGRVRNVRLGETSAFGDRPRGQAPQRGRSGHGRIRSDSCCYRLRGLLLRRIHRALGRRPADRRRRPLLRRRRVSGRRLPPGAPTENNPLPPANGVDRDLNEDGWYCIKTEANTGNALPGNGNTGNDSDIKDNNRPSP